MQTHRYSCCDRECVVEARVEAEVRLHRVYVTRQGRGRLPRLASRGGFRGVDMTKIVAACLWEGFQGLLECLEETSNNSECGHI